MRNFKPTDFEGGKYLIRMSDTELSCIKQNKDFDNCLKTSTLYCSLVKTGYFYDKENADFHVCLIEMSDGFVRDGHFINDNQEKITWNSNVNGAAAKQKLCDYLNSQDCSEYRFATQEEVIRVLLYQTDRL